MADSTKIMVHMSTVLGGMEFARSSHVMSATNAVTRPELYCECSLTSLTASAEKSQACMVAAGQSSRRGKAALPAPHPT